MTNDTSSIQPQGTDSAFIELAIEMANLGQSAADGEEGARIADSILKEADKIRRTLEE